MTADGKPIRLKDPTVSGNPKPSTATAIDGDPQTGWSINGGQGKAHSAVFRLAAPLDNANDLGIQMLFERYHAAGLGRFRISVTTDPRPIDGARSSRRRSRAALLTPKPSERPPRTSGFADITCMVAPELAKERAAIERLRRRDADVSDHAGDARAAAGQPPADLHPQPRRVSPADRAGRAGRSVDPAAVAERTSSPTAWRWRAGWCRPRIR